MDEHGQHLHDVVGPYDEGSTITFICEVDGEGGAEILAVGSPPLRASIRVTATTRNDVSVNGPSSFTCHNGWTENNGSSRSSILLLRRRRGWRGCPQRNLNPIKFDEHRSRIYLGVISVSKRGYVYGIIYWCEGGAQILAVGSPPLRASIRVTATTRNDVSVNGPSSFTCHNGWTENNGSSRSSILLLRRRRGWRGCPQRNLNPIKFDEHRSRIYLGVISVSKRGIRLWDYLLVSKYLSLKRVEQGYSQFCHLSRRASIHVTATARNDVSVNRLSSFACHNNGWTENNGSSRSSLLLLSSGWGACPQRNLNPIKFDEHRSRIYLGVINVSKRGITLWDYLLVCIWIQIFISEEGGAGILAVGSPPLRASIHVTATARNDVSVNGLSSFACHDNGWTENNGRSKSSPTFC
ncbi:hypothetical protein CDAR_532451 [Caerostris darwini]|uniref:Uncharacterized protein n=1 Tax=Caerostris darwini TaxID=1538125 RepID=A0AAV4Q9V8_9ARAC|nr:hypothetical protein CDAR_532451 [Caerostris darwini]